MPEPSDLDRSAIRRQFDRRAAQAGAADFLLREVESRMLDRLELIRLQPECILDLGSGFGQGISQLAQRWPGARALGLDLSTARLIQAAARHRPPPGGWLDGLLRRLGAGQVGPGARPPSPHFVAGDAHALPLPAGSVDLLWSNLVLHWLDDVPTAIGQWHQVLRPGGLLMFSALGVDTLVELRHAGVDLAPFPDLHDLGDALVKAGFADPVMDAERLTITWRELPTLLTDLRALGGNPRRGRTRGLLGPSRLRQAQDALGARLKPDPDTPVPLTFELIYGHAWRAAGTRRSDGLQPIAFHPRGTPQRR